MNDDLRIFIALLATCPAIALFMTIAMAFTGDIDEAPVAVGFWAVITVLLLLVVSVVGALVFVWQWAMP